MGRDIRWVGTGLILNRPVIHLTHLKDRTVCLRCFNLFPPLVVDNISLYPVVNNNLMLQHIIFLKKDTSLCLPKLFFPSDNTLYLFVK